MNLNKFRHNLFTSVSNRTWYLWIYERVLNPIICVKRVISDCVWLLFLSVYIVFIIIINGDTAAN